MRPSTGALPGGRRDAAHRWALAVLILVFFAAAVWYAATGLGPDRPHFFDERYSFENVYGLLFTNSWSPVSAWYPSLAYLPQTAALGLLELSHRLSGGAVPAAHDGAGFTPAAYLCARLFSSLYGAAALLFVFLLGRRLFDSGIALLAAALLAGVPQLLHHAALFKPDALLVAACLGALLLTDRALERSGTGALLLAGTAAGLATAAKLNGAAVALPLALAALPGGSGGRTRLWRPLAAWATAGGVYLLLNPFLGTTIHFLERNRRLYRIQAGKEGGGHLRMPLRELELLLGDGYHGAILGALALLGAAGLVYLALRRSEPRERRLRLASPLVFLLGYSLLCAVTTPFARFSLFLPIAPVTSLAAAWLVLEPGRRLLTRLPRGRPLLAAAATVAAALALVRGGSFVYERRVPSTLALAEAELARRLDPLDGRVLCAETGGPAPRARRGASRLAVRLRDRLVDLPPAELDRCDAELFPGRRLGRPSGDAERYAARLGRPAAEAVRLTPRLFAVRGPELVVLLHPWRGAAAERLELEPAAGASSRWRAELTGPPTGPAIGPGFVSLTLQSPERASPPVETRVRLGGEPLELLWLENRKRPWGAVYLTPRLPLPGAPVDVEIDLPPAAGTEPPLAGIWRWLPPAPPPRRQAAAEPAERSR